MKSIFESQKTFEDALVEFAAIRTQFDLSKFILKKMSPKKQKVGFIWQMQGNQVIPTIEDAIEGINKNATKYGSGKIEYYNIGRTESIEDLLSKRYSHIYRSYEDAMSDETEGVAIVGEFTRMSPNMRKFIMSMINGENGYYLGKNWRFIVTGNVENGDDIWNDAFSRMFDSRMLELMPVSKEMYADDDDDDDGFYESKKQKAKGKSDVSESVTDYFDDPEYGFMSIDEAKDKIYTIIYNAAKKGEISPDEYIFIDDDCVVVDKASGFDADTIKYARRADLFIDFDALEDGRVIIYTKPLYTFIEENVMVG